MPASSKKAPSQFDGLKSLGTSTGTPVAEVEPVRKVGRPLKQGAKSRDEDYRAWGGYLKSETLNDANYELGKVKGGSRDMSDLLQELLAGWVAERQKKGSSKQEDK